ncbi:MULTISPECIES: hypothetical protein [Pantoea]|uniref:Uncharacterized protein n=1 Tax=Candidatus Pantoea floridensis TaxID=1938870 RepID=A0A286BZX3_9GAMM|nr:MULTISPECIES: hypothetical protein [Pantoea]PIF22199.1 hypothetical protein BX596_1608 [Enterobacteriaceae bacterium JKS000233]PXW18517.1 hypothetical protein BY447_0070 [Pantoea sp. JKS000250]SOD39706.1 hypothetical protein SAMN06273570_4160 [Pantoea floridensis]
MITSPQSSLLGGPSVNSGYIPPSTCEVSGEDGKAIVIQPQPDLSDIDLLLSRLDSRVVYSGPPHLFWNQNGILQTSNINEWPVEYQNGVAIGRSFPEPQTTNYLPNCRAIALSNNVKASADFDLIVGETSAPDGGAMCLIPVASAFYLISQDIGGVDLIPGTPYTLSTEWNRLVFPVTPTANSVVRIWIGRNINDASGNTFVFIEPSSALNIGDYVFSWFAKAGDEVTFPAGCGMIENSNYPYATSPIITEDANQGIRTESSVSIAQVGDSQSIVIVYDDLSLEVSPFNGADSVSLPFATFNWGERYITRIKYLSNVPDLSPIDLTAETLDSRVSYSGPSHTYVDSFSALATSNENEWPLEYQDSVAIGRHEPEGQTINYAPDTVALDIAPPGNSATWMYSQGSTITYGAIETSQFNIINTETPKIFINVYNESEARFFFSPDVNPGTDSTWQRNILTFENTIESTLRFYTQREGATSYLYQHCPGVPVGSFVASVFRRLTDTNMQSEAPQLEIGTFPTSPIFNDRNEQNTRLASSVTVKNPGGAKNIVLHFSDGTRSTVPFVSDIATLPLASQAWATRYITQITFSN